MIEEISKYICFIFPSAGASFAYSFCVLTDNIPCHLAPEEHNYDNFNTIAKWVKFIAVHIYMHFSIQRLLLSLLHTLKYLGKSPSV